MSRAPYTFGEAVDRSNQLSSAQTASEQATRDAYGAFATAEKAYRVSLARKITELRSEGVAATLAGDLARGDETVAGLKYRRDVCAGVVEAAKQAGWHHQANRRDGEEFLRWSRVRDLAENGGGQPQWSGASS